MVKDTQIFIDEIIEKAAAEIRASLQGNSQRIMDNHKRLELDINKIETVWGDMKSEVNGIINRVVNEVVNSIPEEEVVDTKKKSWNLTI